LADDISARKAEFCLLGPMLVRQQGSELPVARGSQRAVLAALLLNGNHVVGIDELADAVWGQAAPPSARITIQNYVKRLRHALRPAGTDRIATSADGYVIRLAVGELDVSAAESEFSAAQAAASANRWDQAGAAARSALSRWRGPPLADVESEMLTMREVPRLTEMRMQASELEFEALIRLGLAVDVTVRARQLIAGAPLRERLHALLMRALYCDGRQAEALAAYQQTRRLLAEELGTEPGPELRELHQRMLNGDATLLPEPPTVVLEHAPGPVQQPVTAPRELPGSATHFTGRDGELAALTRLLDQAVATGAAVPIAVISGMAGVGKTALAVSWAHQIATRFPDGQLYVNLRGCDAREPLDPADALAGFLRSLGLTSSEIPADSDERGARYRSMLAPRRVLVVLDNAHDAAQVRPLLPGSAGCAAVVTSRDVLAGLVARDGASRLDLEVLHPAAAVGLLRSLLGPARVDAEPEMTADLARQCGYLPLALRVAAELAGVRPDASLAELTGELTGHHGRLLRLDARVDQETAMKSVFSWSYTQLPAPAARIFRLVGLHPGPGLDAYAVAALADGELHTVSALLEQLSQAHLVEPADRGRYRMHDLLREYAEELALTEDSEQQRRAAVSALCDFYLGAAITAANVLYRADAQSQPAMPQGVRAIPSIPNAAAALAWLNAERPAFPAISALAVENGKPDTTVSLAAALSRYLLLGGYRSETAAIHAQARRAAALTGGAKEEARNLADLGTTEFLAGHYDAAGEHLRQARDVSRRAGDVRGQARAAVNLGGIALHQGQTEAAACLMEEALVLYRQLGSDSAQARTLANLSVVNLVRGELDRATEQLQRALALSSDADPASRGLIRNNLGHILLRQKRYRAASQEFRAALDLAGASGNAGVEIDALRGSALACLGLRQHDRARSEVGAALRLIRTCGNTQAKIMAVVALGNIELAAGRPAEAYACQAAAVTDAAQANSYSRACLQLGLSRASAAMGQPGTARGHLLAAYQLYQAAGAIEASELEEQVAASGGATSPPEG
jgi:DNA-binding SARP family transcriptional activator/tetratricopeptide (TPR) repeat protein